MLFLTLQIALTSLSFLYNSPKFLPQIETIPTFETAWKANLDLAKTMSKDNRIADFLEPANWKKLQDVSSYVDLNDPPLVLFSVLEEILRVSYVERIAQEYPEYEFALLTITQLSVSITEFYRPPEMIAQNWNKLLELSRMENVLAKKCREVITVTSNCTDISTGDDENVMEMKKYFSTMVPTTTENAVHFLQAGSHFRLPYLIHSSAQFLEKVSSMENIVMIYQAAVRTKMEDLKKKAEEFISFEFEEISKEDKKFPVLKFNELFSLLMSGKLTVRSEDTVFQAIVRWVLTDARARTEHLPTLMKTVRLHLCPLSLLNKMLDHFLLKDFQEIQHSIRSAVYLIQLNSPKLPDLIKKQQRLLQETLFVMGGYTSSETSLTIETFSTSQQQWIYHQRLNNGSKGQTSAVPLGKQIIVFFHEQYTVSSFDPVKQEWKSLSKVANNRRYFSVAVLNGMIYVLGGNTNAVSDVCERYDPKSNRWTKLPSLNTARRWASAATLQDKVYIAGGLGSTYLNTVEMFNPETNRWNFIQPMNSQRYSFALVSEDNYLWAFGGHTGSVVLNSVERYDPKSGMWTFMPALPVAKYAHSVAYFSGNFFVIGDYGGEKDRVDIYNPRKKTWSRGPSLNLGRYSLASCVLKELPNAADYLTYEN